MKFVTYKDDTLVRAIWDTVLCTPADSSYKAYVESNKCF